MALPALITISGLPDPYTNGNGVYVSDGYGSYYNANWYVLMRDGTNWAIRTDNYQFIVYSDSCDANVSPVDVEWGNIPAVGSISIDASDAAGVYIDDGADWWYRDDYAYYITWGDDRWEVWDNSEPSLFAWSQTGISSDPRDIGSAQWNETFQTAPNLLYLSISIENADINISTPEELQAIGTNAYSLAGNYIQTANINLGVSPYNTGGGFAQIGTSAAKFTGTYDGQDFEIQSLYINRTTINGIGLFGYTASTCVLKNIKLRSCAITGASSVGTLAGETGGSSITNCSSTGTVSGTGWNVGGLIGKLNSGVIEKSWSCATATCTGSTRTNLGGLFGSLEGWNGQSRCLDCYATGRVTGSATTDSVGGFAGNVSSAIAISRCYALGLATGRNNVGQFSGKESSGPPTVTACYWISDDGASTSRHGTRLSTAQAKDKSNYTGWNFRTLWDIHPAFNGGYPFLNPRKAPSAASSLYQSVYRKR